MAGTGADIMAYKIFACFIHSDDSNGGEMVFPVKVSALFNFPQIELGIGVEILICEHFQHFSFYDQALFRQTNHFFQAVKKVSSFFAK